jgi:hypothetical protein
VSPQRRRWRAGQVPLRPVMLPLLAGLRVGRPRSGIFTQAQFANAMRVACLSEVPGLRRCSSGPVGVSSRDERQWTICRVVF